MDIKPVTDFLERLARDSNTEIETIGRDRKEKGDVPFIVIDKNRTLLKATDIITDFEKTQPTPFRRKGTYAASSVESFVRWLDNNTESDAPVFGTGLEKLNGEWRKPKLALVGIGNYSDREKPEWHDFKARYDFPVDHAWVTWAAKHSDMGDSDKVQWFLQEEFAEFIEQRIHDLSSPKRDEELGEAVTRFLEAAGFKQSDAATPATMFKISRELKISAEEQLETEIDLQSGETKIKYSSQHKGAGGHPIKVPTMFFIRIPVFFGQDPVLIGVKLRYRKAGPSLMWAYSLFAPEIIVREEFDRAAQYVKASRQFFLGEPD